MDLAAHPVVVAVNAKDGGANDELVVGGEIVAGRLRVAELADRLGLGDRLGALAGRHGGPHVGHHVRVGGGRVGKGGGGRSCVAGLEHALGKRLLLGLDARLDQSGLGLARVNGGHKALDGLATAQLALLLALLLEGLVDRVLLLAGVRVGRHASRDEVHGVRLHEQRHRLVKGQLIRAEDEAWVEQRVAGAAQPRLLALKGVLPVVADAAVGLALEDVHLDDVEVRRQHLRLGKDRVVLALRVRHRARDGVRKVLE